jgi:hypothetical protein
MTLNTYNLINSSISPPIPPSTTYGMYIVPTWNHRLDHDVLTGSGQGYFKLSDAYCKNNDSVSYVEKTCN